MVVSAMVLGVASVRKKKTLKSKNNVIDTFCSHIIKHVSLSKTLSSKEIMYSKRVITLEMEEFLTLIGAGFFGS